MTGPQRTPKSDDTRRAGMLGQLEARGDFDIPPGLEPPELKIVQDIIETQPAGVIGQIDSAALEMMLTYHAIARKALAAWQANPKDRNARQSANSAFDRFHKLAASFGLTPSGRAAVPQPDPGDDDLQKLVGRLNE